MLSYYKLAQILFAALVQLLDIICIYYHRRPKAATQVAADLGQNQGLPNKNIKMVSRTLDRKAQAVSGSLSKNSMNTSSPDVATQEQLSPDRRGPQMRLTQLEVIREQNEEDQSKNEPSKIVRSNSRRMTALQAETPGRLRTTRKSNTQILQSPDTTHALQRSSFHQLETFRSSDDQLLHSNADVVKAANDPKTKFLTFFNWGIRCLLVQGLIGWLQPLPLHSVFVGLIVTVVTWILKLVQADNKYDQLVWIQISTFFLWSTFSYLEVDQAWTLTLLVVLVANLMLDIVVHYVKLYQNKTQAKVIRRNQVGLQSELQ